MLGASGVHQSFSRHCSPAKFVRFFVYQSTPFLRCAVLICNSEKAFTYLLLPSRLWKLLVYLHSSLD